MTVIGPKILWLKWKEKQKWCFPNIKYDNKNYKTVTSDIVSIFCIFYWARAKFLWLRIGLQPLDGI